MTTTNMSSLQSRISSAVDVLHAWRRRARQRRRLMEMPDDALKDIGINRVDAYREFRKPFWRP